MSQNRKIIIIFYVILLTYVLIRAYTLSFTHDESLSFTMIIGDSIWKKTTNNHELNTILMSFSKKLFGTGEFSLRLPNVLSYVLYLMGCFFIVRSSKDTWLLLFGLSAILLNPFLIEFFSLARGYGLSLAFMLMSIFYLIRNGNRYIKGSELLKDFMLTSLFASLAIYANLAVINFFISVMFIFIIKYFYFKNTNVSGAYFSIKFWGLFFISAIPIIFGIKRLLKLKEAKQLYFGASRFIEGFDTLITYSICLKEFTPVLLFIAKLVIALFLLTGVLHLILKKRYDSSLFIMTVLIALFFIGLLLENYLFEAKYPAERTALIYIPIIAVFAYILLLELITYYEIKKLYYASLILCITIPIVINFFAGANFSRTTTWYYDAHTRDVMKIIRDKSQNTSNKILVGNNWLFEPAINYYRTIWHINMNKADRNGINLKADFNYRLDDNSSLDNYLVLKVYDDINSNLVVKTENKKNKVLF